MESENHEYKINQILKISRARIGVLIGSKGSFKKTIEEKLNAKLIINSKEGTVLCMLNDYSKWQKLNNLIMAISRGFSGKNASLLLEENCIVHTINLGNNKKFNIRQKARVIGKEGLIKKRLEKTSGTKISIYGKSITIIGKYENVFLVSKAIGSILSGSKQNSVLDNLKAKINEKK